MILILEDDIERRQGFVAALRIVDPSLESIFWRSARQMIQEVSSWLPTAQLISLDNDLDPWEGDRDDPGEGLEVVKFLVEQSQSCPLIIHTSNGERCDRMAGELELAGWRYHRVAPLGDDWIEEHWARVARQLLRKRSKS